MKNRFLLVFMSILVAVIAAGCGGGNATQNTTHPSGTNVSASQPVTSSSTTAPAETELTITHKLGSTKVKVNPQKVVVFDYGVLDTLEKLGVEVAAVPQAMIPSYLAKYKDAKYVNVGSLVEPDFEKISSLQPDLIIISTRQQKAYEELSKIGPTIFMGLDTTKYIESYTENVNTLAKIFNKQTEVTEELKKVNDSIKKLHEKAAGAKKNALIILANDGKISAYGPGSRFGLIHDVFGFIPVDDKIEVSTHGQSISFEYITEKNPDYLFVIDRGAAVTGGTASAKQLVENELVKKTKAFTNGNIVYLDPNYWYLSGGGLISVAEMVKEVEAGLK